MLPHDGSRAYWRTSAGEDMGHVNAICCCTLAGPKRLWICHARMQLQAGERSQLCSASSSVSTGQSAERPHVNPPRVRSGLRAQPAAYKASMRGCSSTRASGHSCSASSFASTAQNAERPPCESPHECAAACGPTCQNRTCEEILGQIRKQLGNN